VEYGNRRQDFLADEMVKLIRAMIEAEKAFGKES
jgi:hypothetical protein